MKPVIGDIKPGIENMTIKWSRNGGILWGAGFLLLVSERSKTVYEQEGLTGITAFLPVEVVRVGTRKTGDLPPGLPTYYLIEIVWGGANQDDQASKWSSSVSRMSRNALTVG